MAYRRPLSRGQSLILALLWIGLCIYIIRYATPSPYLWLVLLVSGFLVFYPIYKSLKP